MIASLTVAPDGTIADVKSVLCRSQTLSRGLARSGWATGWAYEEALHSWAPRPLPSASDLRFVSHGSRPRATRQGRRERSNPLSCWSGGETLLTSEVPCLPSGHAPSVRHESFLALLAPAAVDSCAGALQRDAFRVVVDFPLRGVRAFPRALAS
jgi:hypothetical protein